MGVPGQDGLLGLTGQKTRLSPGGNVSAVGDDANHPGRPTALAIHDLVAPHFRPKRQRRLVPLSTERNEKRDGPFGVESPQRQSDREQSFPPSST
jgi:hypothetical protein